MIKSTGLLGEQLRRELEIIGDSTNPISERYRNDVLNFDENIESVIADMKAFPDFGVFDFLSKKEIYKVDIGEIQDQMEYELFDSIRVDDQIPFVVLNLNRKKIQGVKGLYLSDDRRFKIYHSKDSPMKHERFIHDWSHSNTYNTPYTLIMKVLVTEPEELLYGNQVDAKSYVDIVYTFGEGLFIELKREQTGRKVDQIIGILRNHITGFQLDAPQVNSISGSFVVDRVLIDPMLFRGILIQPHATGRHRPLLYHPFLWVNEKGQSLALRSQFILNFRLGDIHAKVMISAKEAESSSLFYFNDTPVKFKEGTPHNEITISDVKSPEHAFLVRDIVASVFYLYGYPQIENIGGQPVVFTRSMRWAGVYNALIGGGAREIHIGATFGPTLQISTEDVKSIKKNIMQLRSVDPTFYGKIATGKPISKGDRQPSLVVSTTDPNWHQILLNTIQDVFDDPPEAQRQIIRYPFSIQNPENEEFARVPVTKVPPYFLMCKADAPFFKPKLNSKATGGEGTFHPFLLSCSKREFVSTPGNDMASKYNNLANLNVPFKISFLEKEKSARSRYVLSTPKILKPGVSGSIPPQLSKVLLDVMTGKSNTRETVEENFLDIKFERTGVVRSHDSLLHVLVSQTAYRSDLRNAYLGLLPNDQIQFVRIVLRKVIADSVNWNLARQELFDMEPADAKALFLDPETPVDSRLFKAILEKFFNVFLLVIRYDKVHSTIEIPRHKFYYISSNYRKDVQTMVIFKHVSSDSYRILHPQYELLSVMTVRNENDPLTYDLWNFHRLKGLFDQVNNTVDASFVTVRRLNENKFQTGSVIATEANLKPSMTDIFNADNLLYQYIDGAGKLRAIVHKYTSQLYPGNEIVLTCEPLAPLEMDSFDDPIVIKSSEQDPSVFFQAENFDRAIEFIQSLGIKLDDISYHMESEELHLVEEIIAEVEDPETDEPETIVTDTTDAAREKQMSIMERVMNLPVTSSSAGSAIIPRKPITPARKKKPKTKRTVMRKGDFEPLAIGVWFTLNGVRFYIATEPGTPPTKIFAVDNVPYFELTSDAVVFRQHDYYEKIANIIVQLLRNLYIYSMLDDPIFFMKVATVVDPRVVYDVRSTRRRIPASRDYRKDVVGYYKAFPTFFTQPEIDEDGNIKVFPKLILDSDKTAKGLLQHLKIVQKLKEDIVGASGSKFLIMEAKNANDGVRKVAYQVDSHFWPTREQVPPTIGLSQQIIELIPRMDKFFNRPDYILEFYAYPSDFIVRGPDQHIFMSEDEINQYQELTEMESAATVISLPITQEHQNTKSPMYYAGRDGSFYILQNVVGGSLRRALNLVYAWETERINLGFFTDEWTGYFSDVYTVNVKDLSNLDPSHHFLLVFYGSNSYAALLKLDGSVLF